MLYDLGDFVDDYAVAPGLRNDLGLLFLVTFDDDGPRRLEAVPLALEYCHTRLARGAERQWVVTRFRAACADLGTEVEERAGRLVVRWDEVVPSRRRRAPWGGIPALAAVRLPTRGSRRPSAAR